jgi:hypothetical protein
MTIKGRRDAPNAASPFTKLSKLSFAVFDDAVWRVSNHRVD